MKLFQLIGLAASAIFVSFAYGEPSSDARKVIYYFNSDAFRKGNPPLTLIESGVERYQNGIKIYGDDGDGNIYAFNCVYADEGGLNCYDGTRTYLIK